MTGADISDLKTTFSVFPMGIHGASVTRGQSRLPPLHRLTHPTPRRDPKHSGEGESGLYETCNIILKRFWAPKLAGLKGGAGRAKNWV